MISPNINIPSTQVSRFKTAENLRILMPLLIILVLFLFGKKIVDGIKNSFLFNPLGGVTDGIKDKIDGIKDKIKTSIKGTAEQQAKFEKDKQLIAQMQQNVNNPFNPNFYKAVTQSSNYPNGAHILTAAGADAIVKQIWDGIGYTFDTPAQILAAFNRLTYKTQVSFIAERFAAKHNVDLLQWLSEKLDTVEQKIVLGKIIAYVNNLPVGGY